MIDDDPLFARSCDRLLLELGTRSIHFQSADAALAHLAGTPASLVLADLRMPGVTGLDLVEELCELHPTLPVVVVTAFGTIEAAVDAIHLGAMDFVTKPLDLAQLRSILEQIHAQRCEEAAADLPGEGASDLLPRLLGTSKAMAHVRALARAAARSDVPVLIHGPSGTGKEVLARAIHQLSGAREGPFVPVNCGALPEGLIESELFGSAEGAFTGAQRSKAGLFEAAAGGTLFLDEIGEMPPAGQVKLLRVLQDGRVRPVGGVRERDVDARVIAATNRLPAEGIAGGHLREDLYYRLAVLSIELPPLAARRADLPALCEAILRDLAEARGTGPLRCTPEAIERLESHPWPGNIRELENVLSRVIALYGPLEVIDSEHLLSLGSPSTRAGPGSQGGESAQPAVTLRESEADLIRRTLKSTAGNKAKAARILGISRPNLHFKIKRLDRTDD